MEPMQLTVSIHLWAQDIIMHGLVVGPSLYDSSFDISVWSWVCLSLLQFSSSLFLRFPAVWQHQRQPDVMDTATAHRQWQSSPRTSRRRQSRRKKTFSDGSISQDCPNSATPLRLWISVMTPTPLPSLPPNSTTTPLPLILPPPPPSYPDGSCFRQPDPKGISRSGREFYL